jgi:hypothetical protein
VRPNLEVVQGDAGGGGAPRCPSCDAFAPDAYCPKCGEATRVHAASASEFVHEFIGHYVALEGKLWSTLRLLAGRPGQLTAEFLRGRRVPYVNPLGLYLSLSLIVFALIKLNGVELPQLTMDERSAGVAYSHRFPDPAHPGKFGVATLHFQVSETSGARMHELQQAITLLGRADARWSDSVRRFMQLAPGEQARILNAGFLSNLPYMLIGALPLFALYLKLIYWPSGRHYGEHLVFALHTSAFVFLLASLMILIPGNAAWLMICLVEGKRALISAWDWLQLLPLAWALAYLPAALRRVYGGGLAASWVRALALALVHLGVIAALIVGAELLSILKH